MKIHNEQKSRIITIECIESEKHHYPSYQLAIEVKIEEISANFRRNIWVSEGDITVFIDSLKTLDARLIGEANLKSMSPDEFHLILKNKDKQGHIIASLQMIQSNFSDYTINLKIEFEIDQSQIHKMVSELKNWVR